MDGAKVTMVMMNGDSIELRLLPFDAPTNANRFYRQASTGYWDGLTLHRVEFNFVVQGGSPNANEYRGADAFSRDEVGVDNNRGTLGISTRGHDTGDGQIFINLIDNTRLDYLYTVFAEVVKGMAGVDRMLEGAQIRKIIVRS
jgi:cyclophilin family peptidyl-prolyl cis-trans isomerase